MQCRGALVVSALVLACTRGGARPATPSANVGEGEGETGGAGAGPFEPPAGSRTDAGTTEPVASCPNLTPRRVRRLTQLEYQRIVSDLIGTPLGRLDWVASDPLVHGFDDDADALLVSAGNFEDFAMAAQIAAETADVETLAPCPANAAPATAAACGKAFATTFAARAYGRPPTPTELTRLGDLYDLAASDGYAVGVRVVIEAVLMSPLFLYRSELGADVAGAGGGTSALTAPEMASALSFALTGMRPDAQLLARAQDDPLFTTAGGLRGEARRLAETPQARAHLIDFLRSWLGVRDLRLVNKIPSMFPTFTPALKVDLDTEMSLFIERALGAGAGAATGSGIPGDGDSDGGGTLNALLGGRITVANGALLAAIYAGDSATSDAGRLDAAFGPAVLKPSLRRGVLSLGGWLAAHSPVHRSSPVDRGLAVRTRLFCMNLSPPPPGALAAAPGPGDAAGTTRQKFEQHSTDPTCRGCHRLMDPIGFGMEMMDALGRYRETEAGLPVDSTGVLEGTDVDGAFKGPGELATKLMGSRRVRDCFVLQMFRYLEGRDERPADTCTLKPVQEFFASPDVRIVDLAVEMVSRGNFSQRSPEP